MIKMNKIEYIVTAAVTLVIGMAVMVIIAIKGTVQDVVLYAVPFASTVLAWMTKLNDAHPDSDDISKSDASPKD